MCRYYVKNLLCPYTQVGCKFAHRGEPVDEQNGDAEDERFDESTDEKDGDAEDDFTINENQCHQCKK